MYIRENARKGLSAQAAIAGRWRALSPKGHLVERARESTTIRMRNNSSSLLTTDPALERNW